MIIGVGVDVVDIERIRSLRRRRGVRFCHRVYTPAELQACLGRVDPDSSLAARFAAKEAAMKALGTGWGDGVGWRDLEVVGEAGEVPSLRLHGKAAQRAEHLGADAFHLSLSHDRGTATAFVVLEARKKA